VNEPITEQGVTEIGCLFVGWSAGVLSKYSRDLTSLAAEGELHQQPPVAVICVLNMF
jgi:hypothetical protein